MANPRFFFLAGAFALAPLLASAQPRSGAVPTGSQAQIDAAVQRIGKSFVNQPSRVGLSIGIVKNGQTHFYNFGTTEKGKSQAPTQHTVYEIGSISKTFTSLLLAHAVLEKRVNLQDDVQKYLGAAYANLAYDNHPLKLMHLANTTSSLPDNLPDRADVFQRANPDSIPFLADRLARGYTRQHFYDDLRAVKLDTVPGLLPRHSNVATQLLAYILEGVYQNSYEELVKQYIEMPLGMKSTALVPAGADVPATGYDGKGNRMPRFAIKTMQAAGGLRHSTADMARYVAYQLNEKDAAVALSHQATWGNVEKAAIGFNWNLDRTVDGQRRLHHSGGTFGCASYCELYPALGFGVVLLSNESDRGTQDELQATAEQLREAIYGVPPVLQAIQTGLARRGFGRALDVVAEVRKKYPELHLTEDYVNTWGYVLARQGKPAQAVELFKLNVSLFPKEWNTYDSLAEGYELGGNKELAVANYRRSLALNPKNANAAEHLKKLGAAASE